MKRNKKVFFFSLVFSLGCLLNFSTQGLALNGSSLIGVGISRGMGGAGVAADSQDAPGGILLNPAGISHFTAPHFDFGAAILIPSLKTKANFGVGEKESHSRDRVFLAPEMGFVTPLSERTNIGFSLSTVSGIGIDYRNRDVGNVSALGGILPAGFADYKVNLILLQLAPTLSYQIARDRLSLGVSPVVNYGLFDLGQGLHGTVGIAGRVGLRYKISPSLALGVTYESPSRMKYNRIYDLDRDGFYDSVKLTQPQKVSFGLAFTPSESLLLAVDGKWINWANAAGYKDLDWKNQFVLAVGTQYDATDHFALRLGYNFGTNPVKNHSGFQGELPKTFQGKYLGGGLGGTLAYESLRTIGLPGTMVHHLTAGLSYQIHKNIKTSLHYEHAFAKSFHESGTLIGLPMSFSSSTAVDTVGFGLNFDFR